MVYLSTSKKLLSVLALLLVSCEQNTADQHPTGHQTVPNSTVAQSTDATKATVRYTSGDQVVNGPNDTLHVGNAVLRLVPGSKSDFATTPRSQLPFSEARTILQYGDGQVARIGHTLVVRPFNNFPLRFSDDTHQMRRDDNEETDTHCQFSGSLPGQPYWLIDSLQWERFQPFLVNKYSGHTTPLAWDPEISPNRQFLFVAAPGLDIESSLNGLQLLAISEREVKPLWTKALRNWQPHRVRWLDNHTLAIEQMRFEPTERISYVRLLLP